MNHSDQSVRSLPSVSLIVSTYNRPQALRLVLEGISRQSDLPLEVLIGDDGSTAETAELIEQIKAEGFPTRLVHIRHEDRGFRLAEIRNKTVAAASGDYIVQIDGDIIPDRHFIADHRRLARQGFFVKGTRVMLTDTYTKRLETSGQLPIRMPGFLSQGVAKNRLKTIRFGSLGLRRSFNYRRGGTGLGANMAFWRSDFIAVNGYDENFVGWGCEDTDLMERMLRLGLNSFKTFHVARVYHLFHSERDTSTYEKAWRTLEEKEASGEIICKNGVSKWLNQK